MIRLSLRLSVERHYTTLHSHEIAHGDPHVSLMTSLYPPHTAYEPGPELEHMKQQRPWDPMGLAVGLLDFEGAISGASAQVIDAERELVRDLLGLARRAESAPKTCCTVQ